MVGRGKGNAAATRRVAFWARSSVVSAWGRWASRVVGTACLFVRQTFLVVAATAVGRTVVA